MGMSAGGNIAYQAGLRVAAEADHLRPLNIRGLILQQPFFGGTQRSESELRLVNDPTSPLCVTDLMWELSLPIGVDRDHEYCNPTVGGGSKLLEKIRLLGWKVLVTGCDGDHLFDRQVELAKLLEEHGVHVVGHFGVGGCHGVDFHDSSRGKAFLEQVKNFILI
ncbi:hypothetical protein ACB092_10G182600 [Castanea dentata]